MKPLSLEQKTLDIFETSYIRLSDSFEDFDINLLSVNVEDDSCGFVLKYGYSVDSGVNYTNHVSKDLFVIETHHLTLPKFISIFVERFIHNDLHTPSTIYHKDNVYRREQIIRINSIKYNDVDIKKYKVLKIGDVINQYPKWNFYDGQQINVNRWLRQCNSIAEMYGHTCIYFKTDAVETSHTLKHTSKREVTSVKKIPILFPRNEIGDVDKIVYSDWDQPLQDDFISHIVVDKFHQAFGENEIPNSRDFMYIPFLNKMYSVGIVQPNNGFMGKIGWWEVFLLKYEDDETVSMNQQLVDDLENVSDFEKVLDLLTAGELLNIYGTDYLEQSEGDNIIEQIEDYKEDTTNSMENIWEKTTDDNKVVTEGFTNKLVDSTWYISAKETDKIREYYHERLKIVTVKTDDSAYPLQVYDCRTVENNVVAMQYKLTDYTEKSKNEIDGNVWKLIFDFIPMDKFNGSVIDLVSTAGTLSILEIKYSRQNKLNCNIGQIPHLIDYTFDLKEIYQIFVSINKDIDQLAVKIFGLKNKEKTLLYENIYTIDIENYPQLGYIHLFGGKFFLGSLEFESDDKNIMKDYCNPLLIMRNF